jgi:hypothetical protein
MTDLRSVKLLAATLLVCTGSVCVALGGPTVHDGPGIPVGILLMAFGIPMLIHQWTGASVLAHLANAVRWLFVPGRTRDEESPTEAVSRT